MIIRCPDCGKLMMICLKCGDEMRLKGDYHWVCPRCGGSDAD